MLTACYLKSLAEFSVHNFDAVLMLKESIDAVLESIQVLFAIGRLYIFSINLGLIATRCDMLVGMGCLITKTQPAKLVLTVHAIHVHAACILIDVNVALRTLFRVVLLPLDVKLVNNLIDLLPPFADHRAWNRLMSRELALHTSQKAAFAGTVFGSKFILIRQICFIGAQIRFALRSSTLANAWIFLHKVNYEVVLEFANQIGFTVLRHSLFRY